METPSTQSEAVLRRGDLNVLASKKTAYLKFESL